MGYPAIASQWREEERHALTAAARVHPTAAGWGQGPGSAITQATPKSRPPAWPCDWQWPDLCYNWPAVTDNKTCIVQCKKCGLRTRHEWQRWERWSLLTLLTGRVNTVGGWVCTKCGRRRVVR